LHHQPSTPGPEGQDRRRTDCIGVGLEPGALAAAFGPCALHIAAWGRQKGAGRGGSGTGSEGGAAWIRQPPMDPWPLPAPVVPVAPTAMPARAVPMCAHTNAQGASNGNAHNRLFCVHACMRRVAWWVGGSKRIAPPLLDCCQ
jgi:hypothetical protein